MVFCTDRMSLCDLLMANGTDSNCTVGVNNVAPYLQLFDCLEISDQVHNPAGSFNVSQLLHQARQLPYVMIDLLNRSDVMMLSRAVLPGYLPDTSFLNASDVTLTTTTPVTSMPPEGSAVLLCIIKILLIKFVNAVVSNKITEWLLI